MGKQAKKKTKGSSGGRTQSVRFNERQASVIEQAAKLKRWKVAKFIQEAAVEKAIGTVNQELASSEIHCALRLVARLMIGVPPRFWYEGNAVNMRRLLEEVATEGWPGADWYPDEDATGDVMTKRLDGIPHACLVYDVDNKEVSIWKDHAEQEVVKIRTHHLAPVMVQEVFEAVKHCGGPDFAALLKSIYEQELYGSKRERPHRKMIDPKDLIDSS